MGWSLVLAITLPARRTAAAGALAGAAIAALDLGLVGSHHPRIRRLPPLPQLADHVTYGAVVGSVLARRRRVHDVVAVRTLPVAPSEVFHFLADLRNHWLLDDRFVELSGLDADERDRTVGGRVRLKGPFGIAREARTRVLSARPPVDGSPGRLAGRADIGTTTTGRVSWEIAAGQDGGSLVTLAALAERVSLLDRVLLVCGRWWLQRTFDRALLNLDRILSPYVSPSPSRVSLRGCMQSRRPGDAGLEAQAEHGPGSPRRQPDDASGSRAWHCATGLRSPGETGRTSGLPRRTPSGTERTATPSGSSPNTAAAPPMCATSRPIPGCGSRSGDSGARAPLPCCPATILGSGNASSAAGSTQRLARLMGTDLLTVRIDLDEPMIGLRGRDMTTPRREAPEPSRSSALHALDGCCPQCDSAAGPRTSGTAIQPCAFPGGRIT